MGDLKNKKALVTGAEQGIGKAVAEELLNAGCDVFAHYYIESDDMQELNRLAEGNNRRIEWFQADLTDEAQAVVCVAQAGEFLGGVIDVLVNNVGGLVERRRLEEVDIEFWQKVIDINMTTMMLITREATPLMAKAENGASIVNLSSLAGRKGGHPGSLIYSMTKGAVLTLTRALAVELGPRGIRCNAVAPGLMLGTRFHNTHTTPESAKKTVESIPIGRAGDAYDVSRAVLFFAQEYDGFISGATLDINGGVYCA